MVSVGLLLYVLVMYLIIVIHVQNVFVCGLRKYNYKQAQFASYSSPRTQREISEQF